jgi:hypothetical protein
MRHLHTMTRLVLIFVSLFLDESGTMHCADQVDTPYPKLPF